jgi:formylglycine-generating enzyme required for sulfatase activity
MPRVKSYLLGFLLIAAMSTVFSCSEDKVTMEDDTVVPTTAVVYPISSADNRIDVSDSTDIYVAALDNSGIANVEVWTASESDDTPVRIADLRTPLPAGQIPDSLRPEDGSAVYVTRWRTRFIPIGTIVRIFSRAFDVAGNATRSELIPVRIFNEGDTIRAPEVSFTIRPASGTVEDVFTFDASGTRDPNNIDSPSEIKVRWDFDGDEVWDRDFDEGLPATQVVEFKYTVPRVYTVTLEAKSTYPNETGTRQRSLEVTNVGGTPNPPEPDQMILIPTGVYRVGTADESLPEADADEFPLHAALMTVEYFIRKTEVPNRLYLKFLQAEMSGGEPRVQRDVDQDMLIYYPNLAEPLEEDSLPQTIVDLGRSALFYDPDRDEITVNEDEVDLPVVGVSWFGAKVYAESFGLRLPTEHEWEVAAKADSLYFNYPWGDSITVELANYNDPENTYEGLRPIGSYPDAQSPFGLLDVSGNAKEWVKDWYAGYESGQQTDPEGPLFGTRKVIRGGSYLNTRTGVRVTAREGAEPTMMSGQIGFRTAYTRPQE